MRQQLGPGKGVDSEIMLVSRRGSLQGIRAFSKLLLCILSKEYLRRKHKANTISHFLPLFSPQKDSSVY